MKRNIVFLGLIIVVIVCIAMLLIRTRPLSYGGKTIYQWLEETDRSRGRIEFGPFRISDWNKEPIERVTEAFRAMGTNAIPILLQELSAEDSLLHRKLKMDGLLNDMHQPGSWERGPPLSTFRGQRRPSLRLAALRSARRRLRISRLSTVD